MTPEDSAVSDIVTEIADLCKEVGVDEGVKRGPRAKYPNSLIITLLILKGLLGFNSEASLLRFLKMHHGDVFTQLPERSWFNRKAKNVVEEEKKVHTKLLEYLQVKNLQVEIVDTMPVPVITLHRSRRCKQFVKKSEVAYGYCASKDIYYYGKKLTLFVTETGIPTAHDLCPANKHDLVALKQMLPEHSLHGKVLVADKGYYDGELRVTLSKSHNAKLVVPDKKRHTVFNSKRDIKLLRKRSIIETINNMLDDQFCISRTKAQSNSGLISRVSAIILSFTFAIFHNLLHNRPPLAIKSILT